MLMTLPSYQYLTRSFTIKLFLKNKLNSHYKYKVHKNNVKIVDIIKS